MENLKTYIGISTDNSASMQYIKKQAAKDYNTQIATIKENAIQHSQDVIVSVVNCGYGSSDKVNRQIVNSSVTVLQPINESSYETNGRGTPLYDSIGELIEIFENSPDANDTNVSFLLLIITDGEENSSRKWSASLLRDKIKKLQATDRWTFSFRVPKGYGRSLISNLGLYEGNVQEWDVSTRGIEQATVAVQSAMSGYFTARSKGSTSTKSFYSDLSQVSDKDIKTTLKDISSEVQIWQVQTLAEGQAIREFVEHKLGTHMKKGAAFYELMKPEKKVQDNKQVIIKDKNTNVFYGGSQARDMIGLPRYGDASLKPGDHSHYQIFIQSTSVNRKLPIGTNVAYWENMGVSFKEGKSA
jgi:hypothetical protein